MFIEGKPCEESILETGGTGVSTENVRGMHTVGNQNMPPQVTSLWHKEYFELWAKGNQQTQKDAVPELPLCE